jgi:hypothetical protein
VKLSHTSMIVWIPKAGLAQRKDRARICIPRYILDISLFSQSIFLSEFLGEEVHEVISFVKHPGRRHSGVIPRLVDRSLIQRFMYAEPADTLMSVS